MPKHSACSRRLLSLKKKAASWACSATYSSPSFESIYVNDPDTHAQIQNYVSLIAPERADIVKLYTKSEPIFDHFSITRQIKSSFGKTVSFKNGAYIIIEHTEALHVVDVNSGNRTKASNDQETNALEVNLRAADEIARQLRLRDMGGIIVVDFIDMAKAEHRQQLYDHMRESWRTTAPGTTFCH